MKQPVPPVRYHRGHPYLPQFWDYYCALPDIYDRFALSTDLGVAMLDRVHGLAGLDVLDVASGTGRSTFAIAGRANNVIGVEPDDEMLALALNRQRTRGIAAVDFVHGSTTDLSAVAGTTFDLVTCFHGPPFFESGSDERDRAVLGDMLSSLTAVLRPRGALAFVVAAPGSWLPGAPQIAYDPGRRMEAALKDEGFSWIDEDLLVDYGSSEEALATYGFIYGPGAIDWLLETGSTGYTWRNRVYFKLVPS